MTIINANLGNGGFLAWNGLALGYCGMTPLLLVRSKPYPFIDFSCTDWDEYKNAHGLCPNPTYACEPRMPRSWWFLGV